MKIIKAILLALTAALIGFAVYAQIAVSGENLLSYPTKWGFFLARSYRWFTIAAVILLVLCVAVFVLSAWRKKRKGKTVLHNPKDAQQTEEASQTPEPIAAVEVQTPVAEEEKPTFKPATEKPNLPVAPEPLREQNSTPVVTEEPLQNTAAQGPVWDQKNKPSAQAQGTLAALKPQEKPQETRKEPPAKPECTVSPVETPTAFCPAPQPKEEAPVAPEPPQPIQVQEKTEPKITPSQEQTKPISPSAPAQPEAKFCKKCGSPREPGAKFCKKCGNRF